MTATLPASFLAPAAPSPYCEGCSHPAVLRALDRALVALRLDPADVVIVTDIGCVGLAGELLAAPHTVHALHGRSPATATGLALADAVLGGARLKTIVLIGDGGATVGIGHLVHAALLDADVTVLVHNNSLSGITGLDAAVLGPEALVAGESAAGAGAATPPLDLVRLLGAAQASFLARCFAEDDALPATIEAAIRHPGFALIEVVEHCPARAPRWPGEAGGGPEESAALDALRCEPQRRARIPFAQRHRHQAPPPVEPTGRAEITPAYRSALDRPVSVVLAGTAGERVQTAAHLLCAAAVAAELDCTQKNDNPITVGTGFSLAEVVLSPFEISYTGIEWPDALVITSAEGLAEVRRRGLLTRLASAGRVIADQDLALEGALSLPLRAVAGPDHAALAGVFAWLASTAIIPLEALAAAVRAAHADAEKTARLLAFARTTCDNPQARGVGVPRP